MASLTGSFTAVGDASPWVAPAERFLLAVPQGNGGTYVVDVRAVDDKDTAGFLTDEAPLPAGTLREIIPAASGNKQYRIRCTVAPSAATPWRIIP